MVKSIAFSVSTQRSVQRCFWIKLNCLYGHPGVLKVWTIGSVIFALIFCFSISVEAGMVYGRVFGADGSFSQGDIITFFNEKGKDFPVKTDEHRGYSIFLQPGIYKAEFKKGGNTWEAWIKSFPNSVRQDIHLKKGG